MELFKKLFRRDENDKKQDKGETFAMKETINMEWTKNHHDNSGILYWLGCNRGTATYKNPLRNGNVRCTSKLLSNGTLDLLVGNEIADLNTASLENSWFAIDLTPSNIRVIPTHYRLGSGCFGNFVPRHWIFQGSNDGKNWTNLSVHINDETLTADNPIHVFEIKNTEKLSFTNFKLVQTGENIYKSNLFMACCVDIWGTVIIEGALIKKEIKKEVIIERNEDGSVNIPWSGKHHDNSGILYWLATKGKTDKYMNPLKSQFVTCSSEILSGGRGLEVLVGTQIEQLNTASISRSWFQIDFLNIEIIPTHYRIGSGHDGAFLPRYWILQGYDGYNWHDLSIHDNDNTLTESEPIHVFTIDNPKSKAYSKFKLIQTGLNSYGCELFMVCAVDFWGTIIDTPVFPQVEPNFDISQGKIFKYSGQRQDENGILYWLATADGTYINPHISGRVKASASCISFGQIEYLVGTDIVQLNTSSIERPWFSIDFSPSTIMINPTHYRMASGLNGTFLPRHWIFQGSNDGKEWIDISVHEDDETLTVDNPIHTFSVNCKDSYSHFRLMQTGSNTYGVLLFMCCAVEIYGTVCAIGGGPPMITSAEEYEIIDRVLDLDGMDEVISGIDPNLFSIEILKLIKRLKVN
jgi:hypothetical protein